MVRNPQAKMTCVFCGGDDKLTGEHIFGDWIRRLGYGGEGLREIYPSDATFPIRQKGGPFSKKLNIVCLRCNGVWMSQMENDAKPTLIRMFDIQLGDLIELSESEQLALARWAFKTIVVLSYVDPKNTYRFPRAHRREFHRADEPPMNVQIRIGATPGSMLRTAQGDMVGETRFQPTVLSVSLADGSVTQYSAYQASVRLFNVVIMAIGYVADDSPFQFEASNELAETTTLVWPRPGGPVRWEPRMGASIIGSVANLSELRVLQGP